MPDVTVRYFAMLREARQCELEEVSLPAGTTASQAFTILFGASPLASLPVAFAVNEAYVDAGRVLEPGDELSFIPPVGGG